MDDSSRNYYDILGLDRNATTDEIKVAYKEIARVYHPDSNFYREIVDEDTVPEAGLDVFKLLTAAYTTLSHPDKRAQYDLTLPPQMTSWEADPAAEFHQAALLTKVERRVRTGERRMSEAYGIFGKSGDKSLMDEELERKINSQASVVRKAVRRGGFFRRLFGVFSAGR